MSIISIEETLILDKGSKALKEQFERHCDWCWYHGFGNCDNCRKKFNKYYIPIRKEEIQIRLGLKEQK